VKRVLKAVASFAVDILAIVLYTCLVAVCCTAWCGLCGGLVPLKATHLSEHTKKRRWKKL